MQLLQFAFRYILERAKSDRRLAFKQCLGVFTAERFDHGKNIITFDVLFQALFLKEAVGLPDGLLLFLLTLKILEAERRESKIFCPPIARCLAGCDEVQVSQNGVKLCGYTTFDPLAVPNQVTDGLGHQKALKWFTLVCGLLDLRCPLKKLKQK